MIEFFTLSVYSLFLKLIPCCVHYCDFTICFDIWWGKTPIRRGPSFQDSLSYYCAHPDEFWNRYLVKVLPKGFYFLIFYTDTHFP